MRAAASAQQGSQQGSESSESSGQSSSIATTMRRRVSFQPWSADEDARLLSIGASDQTWPAKAKAFGGSVRSASALRHRYLEISIHQQPGTTKPSEQEREPKSEQPMDELKSEQVPMDEDAKPAKEKLEGSSSAEDCKLAEDSDKPPPSAVSAALARLAASPASAIFLQPVESQVSETIAAEYRAIISKPICLEDIQQRASRQPGYAYDELERDLRLIVSNCITFNQGTKHGEVYVQTAEEFDSEVSALMRQLGKEPNESLRAVTPTPTGRRPPSSRSDEESDSEDGEEEPGGAASDRSLVVAWSLMDSPKPTAEEYDEDGGDRGEDEEISQLTLMQSPGFMGLGLNSDSGSELNSFSATKPPPIRQQKQARQAADETEAWRIQQQQERRAQMLRDQQQASLREMEEQEEKKAEEEKRQRDKDLTASRKPHPPSPCGTSWTESSDPPEI